MGDNSLMTVFNASEDQLIEQLVVFKIFEGTVKDHCTACTVSPSIGALLAGLHDHQGPG